MVVYFKKLFTMMRPAYLPTAERFKEFLQSDSELEQAIGRALQKVRRDDFSSEELVFIEAIEGLRSKLLTEKKVVSVLDYGAGTRKNKSVSGEIMLREERISSLSRISSKSKRWCKVLFALVRELKPAVTLELGTSVGMSGAYLAAAVQLNGSGNVYTLEGSPSLVEIARKNFQELQLSRIEVIGGDFQKTLPEVLEKEKKNISFVFLDGNHKKTATIEYVEQVKPTLAEKAVLLFDDICWSREMDEAWQSIRNAEDISYSLDMLEMGLCSIEKGRRKKEDRSLLWV